MHEVIEDYRLKDIRVAAALEIDRRKLGNPLTAYKRRMRRR